ncbi:hypothetical protein N7461_004835 [Penicillium sp. DV-2018c]|nr:hypothetical protein N7461_004835 [Penicillium sp. DV-2018c]
MFTLNLPCTFDAAVGVIDSSGQPLEVVGGFLGWQLLYAMYLRSYAGLKSNIGDGVESLSDDVIQ